MKKAWYESVTIWGAVLLAFGGALEAWGIPGAGAFISQIASWAGIPLVVVGLRRAL